MVEATGISGNVLVSVDLRSLPIPPECPGVAHLPDMQGMRDGKPVTLEAVVFRHQWGTYLVLRESTFRWYGVRIAEN